MSQLAERASSSARPVPSRPIPPLQNGDHLTRAEFELRFDATPGLKKAELIDGIVYVAPPVSFGDHGSPHLEFATLVGTYMAFTRGIAGGDNGSVRLDLDNMPQPDLCLFILPAAGGQAKMDEDGYLVGAPEFVAEVAASSASYDLHEKLRLYCRSGVREYVVWRTYDRGLDYFILRQGEYQRLSYIDGVYRSEVLPGLWIDPAALLSGDIAAALQKMQQGIASPEHEQFVQSLTKRMAAPPPPT